MRNPHLARLLAFVHTLAAGRRVLIPFHPVLDGQEAAESFVVGRDQSGCVCVLHGLRIRRVGSRDLPQEIVSASAWSLAQSLSHLTELEHGTLRAMDGTMGPVQMGGSATLRDLSLMADRTDGPYRTRIAAEDWTLDFVDGVPVLTTDGDAKWSLNATVIMVRMGR